ncbi:MAG: hypothetical protein GY940_19480 [bacterium]|nr:hypothetical protein [bacterium]
MTFYQSPYIIGNMKINIAEITKTFAPTFPFTRAYKHLRVHDGVDFNSDALYAKIKELTSKAKPSFDDQWDTTWKFFYLPMKRKGRLICNPFSVNLHRGKAYSICFYGFSSGMGYHGVEKGNDEVPDYYFQFIDETIRFIPVLKEYGNQLIEKTFPPDWRTGTIKRKYITPAHELMSMEESERIRTAYQTHLEKKLKVSEISLNDYLNTAAICYRPAFEDDIKQLTRQMERELTPRDLIKRWADSRHGGMLFIEDPDSKEEYMNWLRSDEWRGAHPFEIVYSTPHGIYLYPPEKDDLFYRLSIADHFYYPAFARMADALVEHNIPFEAYGLDGALEYLTGESEVEVNTMSWHNPTFRYTTSRENRKMYFPHIQWDDILALEWK